MSRPHGLITVIMDLVNEFRPFTMVGSFGVRDSGIAVYTVRIHKTLRWLYGMGYWMLCA